MQIPTIKLDAEVLELFERALIHNDKHAHAELDACFEAASRALDKQIQDELDVLEATS